MHAQVSVHGPMTVGVSPSGLARSSRTKTLRSNGNFLTENLIPAERIAAQLDAAPLQALAILRVAYVEFATTHRGHFRAMFHPGMAAPGAFDPQADVAGSAFDVLVDVITRCQVAGEVRAGSSRELALGAWAIVHGLAVLAVDRQLANRGFSSDDPVVLARELTQQTLRGPPSLRAIEQIRTAGNDPDFWT